MAFTRNQTENMSRDELVEEFIKLSYASSKLSNLTEKFNDFGIYQKTVIPTAKKTKLQEMIISRFIPKLLGGC